MSDVLIAIAAVIAVLWLGALTIVALVLIRQVSAMMVRMETIWSSFGAPGGRSPFGPTIGFKVSDEMVRIRPDLADRRRVLISLSTSCTSCQTIVDDLIDGGLPPGFDRHEVTILLSGPPDAMADSLAQKLDVRTDPEATQVAQALSLSARPGAILLEDGLVAGVSVPQSIADVGNLLADNSRAFRAEFPASDPER